MNIIHPVRAGRLAPVQVACIDKTTVDLGVPFPKLIATLQKAYDRHFLPAWGYPVKLYRPRRPKRTDWQMLFIDDTAQAVAEGDHDLAKHGVPYSKIFVKATLADGELVSVVASHELFEMMIDPIANLWAQAKNGDEYAYEMCDPVEEDTFLVDGIQISNFLYPTWFEPFAHPKGTKFDHLGLLTRPFSMRKTGYVTKKAKGKVKDVFGSLAKRRRFQNEDRRGHRSEYRKPDGKRI
ncbi:MAG TPA: hypothetical protein VHA10_11290 [Hypericibacter adhaerens]|uniref:Uncharacterized protein n=1 Tax=Hypericibacter adhaerens TaxID=2602016 RepID=A0A5J6MSH1_9PROT|nr:hypothetical protein [Hypericibacter adhaerens]QEX20562.1 hypothetical protein FRZ61_04790 [Hypericibacter adhaerens]HWA43787.1 hypothetical protein [Hypericibacter adhaerens]